MTKLSTPLPTNLPENWTYGQIIAPTGQEVGLPANYGYNYLMNQVNNAQKAALELERKKAELDMGNLESPSTALYNLGAKPSENLKIYWITGTLLVVEKMGSFQSINVDKKNMPFLMGILSTAGTTAVKPSMFFSKPTEYIPKVVFDKSMKIGRKRLGLVRP